MLRTTRFLFRSFSSAAKEFPKVSVYNTSTFNSKTPLSNLEEEGKTKLSQAMEASNKRKYEESNSYLDEALNIFQSTFGEEYPELFNVFYTKGKNLTSMKEYKAAEENYKQAMKFTNKVTSYSTEILKLYTDLAWLSSQAHEYDKAESYYKKCFDIISDDGIKYHSYLLTILDDLGHMYHNKGDLRKSLDYHYKALAIIDNSKIDDQPMQAKILTHIAVIQRKLGNRNEAMKCCTQAKDIFEKTATTENPPELGWCYTILGYCYIDKLDYEEAKKIFKRALDIDIKNFGEEKAEKGSAYSGYHDALQGNIMLM